MKIEKVKPLPIDPLVKNLCKEDIENDVKEYNRLLDGQVQEYEIHDFLAKPIDARIIRAVKWRV